MSKENGNEREIGREVLDKFFKAILQDNFDVVKKMCKSNPGIVNLKNSRGDTPLHVAVDLNNLKMMNLLIKRGANVDCLDARNRTPLLLVADCHSWGRSLYSGNHEEALKLLIDSNADVNLVDKRGETALYKATKHANKKLVKCLCNNGAKFHVEGAYAGNPVELARSKLDGAKTRVDSERVPRGLHPYNLLDHGDYAKWYKETYKHIHYLQGMVDALEYAAYRAEHPSVLKQAKQVVVNALGNLSLGNSSATPAAAGSSSQAKRKQQGASQGK